MKVLYSSKFGSDGLNLSEKGVKWLREHGMPEDNILFEYPRHHPLFIKMYEELGDEGFEPQSEIKTEEIDEPYFITSYDGAENISVVEKEFSFFLPKEDCLTPYHLDKDLKVKEGFCYYHNSKLSLG